jgi:hypothetical protein
MNVPFRRPPFGGLAGSVLAEAGLRHLVDQVEEPRRLGRGLRKGMGGA